MTFQSISSPSELEAMGIASALAQSLDKLPAAPAGVQSLIYCDGACSGNGVKEVSPGGWGVALIDASGLQVAFGGEAHTTNNKMELTAAIEALRQTPKGSSVLLRTDSQYVIKGCTEWRAGWIRKGMKNSKGEPVANPEFWQRLWAEVDARKVKFEWVKGHNGDVGNELADSLAVLGTKR